MEELVKQLVEKVGIDKGTAEKVSGLLRERAATLPALLTGDASSLTPLLSKLGIDGATAARIVRFLQEHAAQLHEWVGSQGGGVLQKAKDVLGGMLGGKQSK
jgi:hypothetical protein